MPEPSVCPNCGKLLSHTFGVPNPHHLGDFDWSCDKPLDIACE